MTNDLESLVCLTRSIFRSWRICSPRSASAQMESKTTASKGLVQVGSTAELDFVAIIRAAAAAEGQRVLFRCQRIMVQARLRLPLTFFIGR